MKLKLFIASIIVGCSVFLISFATQTQAFYGGQSSGIEFVAGIGVGGIVEAVAVNGTEAYIGEGTKFVTLGISTTPPLRQAELDLLSIVSDIHLDGDIASSDASRNRERKFL